MKCEVCARSTKAKSGVNFKDIKYPLMSIGLLLGAIGGSATAFLALFKSIYFEGFGSSSPTIFNSLALAFLSIAILILSIRDLARVEKEDVEDLINRSN